MSDKQKVFCIGFMKTGTTTLNRALSILGYRVSHTSWRWLPEIVKEDWESIERLAQPWDALEDNPIPLIYRELDRLFPNSKFILSVRDEEKWYQSVSYHIGNLPSPMHAWLFGKGKELPKDDKNHTIAVFNGHIEGVKAYFRERPEDLMVVDVTQLSDWTPLCSFLGIDNPNQAFPHANKSKFDTDKHAGFARRFKYWKKRMINPVKIAWYQSRGYLPTPEERLRRL